jgi:hypothetical protein
LIPTPTIRTICRFEGDAMQDYDEIINRPPMPIPLTPLQPIGFESADGDCLRLQQYIDTHPSVEGAFQQRQLLARAGCFGRVERSQHRGSIEYELVVSLLQAVRIRGFPIPIEFLVVDLAKPGSKENFGCIEVEVVIHVLHRDTGEPTRVTSRNSISVDLIHRSTAQEILDRMILFTVRELVIHELEECTYFDGHRLSEPHTDSVMPTENQLDPVAAWERRRAQTNIKGGP